jgi:Ca2+:H+ antiporter
MGPPITLGLDAKSTVLLFLTLMVATLSLGTGRTTILQGAVHSWSSLYIYLRPSCPDGSPPVGFDRADLT